MARKIRQARDGAGLSQSQLAGKIGAHFTSVSDWERGINVPSVRHLTSVARETGRALEFFTGDSADDDEEEEDAMERDLLRALRRFVHAERQAVRA